MRRNSKTFKAEPFLSDGWTAALLSAVAGFVDAAGFLALFGLLPSHVTADLVTAGSALSDRGQIGLTARLSMIPLFMLSVAGTALVARYFQKRGLTTVAPLFALMTAALSFSCLSGVLFGRFAQGADSWPIVLIGGTAVMAMAVQNTMMRGPLGKR